MFHVEEEEEEDDEYEEVFSLYRLVETLMETRLFRQTIANSMETYDQELFRRREDRCLQGDAVPWTDEEKEKKCYICLEMFTTEDLVVKLECTHVFHHACAENAVAHQHLRCPLCRAEIPTRSKDEDRNSSGHVIRFPE